MNRVCIAAVGDLVLDEPDPAFFLRPSTGLISDADVSIGHVEVPHSDTTVQSSLDVPAPPADPAALASVAGAGFDVVTLAGNHVYDAGPDGVNDTVRHARDAGLLTAGAGADLAAASAPAIHRAGDTTVGVLSFNCVGPRESWAASQKAGAAYVKVLTHYELDSATPGGPPTIYTFVAPASQRDMEERIAALAAEVDVVVVALHKGVGHTPAVLADYEVPLAHAAVEAGADLVIAHHAHIMRGVEMYQGVPIFHGLGNFVTVTRALNGGGESAERREWADRRIKMFGFAPDPAMPTYPFHPESRNTAMAWCTFADGALVEAALKPLWIDDEARPIPLIDEDTAKPVVDYIIDITRRAGFDTEFTWSGDRVVVSATSTPKESR
ncbi:CapA family protein [Aeromicrobium sp. CF3.5]|uniref:CapA family protein n=1 Tax=Aeromicrobium sp. CF3.5 TaxID=3373078 RepID=UPI003EE6DE77